MVGHHASYEFRWRRWALLRDVVAAHLEDAAAGRRFPRFASIGDALGVTALRLPAADLTAEVRAIKEALAGRSIEELVMGPLTARVLYPNVKLEIARPLTRAEVAQVAPPGDAKTLDAYFASMLDSMLEVCASPYPDGAIEVLDG